MKIDKAIEILGDSRDGVKPEDPADEHDALQLGIDALKRVKRSRDKRFPVQGQELPGETVET